MTAGSEQVFFLLSNHLKCITLRQPYILLMLHKIWNVSNPPTHEHLDASLTQCYSLRYFSQVCIGMFPGLFWSILSFINSSHLHASVYDAYACSFALYDEITRTRVNYRDLLSWDLFVHFNIKRKKKGKRLYFYQMKGIVCIW